MKLIIVNNSSDVYSFVGGAVAIGENSSVEIPQHLWFSLHTDINFLTNLRNKNLHINDGIGNFFFPEAEAQIQKLLDHNSSYVSSGNSSSTPLSAGQTFTGTGEQSLNHSSVTINVYSDQNGSFKVQWSSDNISWVNDGITYYVRAASTKSISYTPISKYFRVVFTNGGVNQTIFKLETICKDVSTRPVVQPVSITLAEDRLSAANTAFTFTANANTTTIFDFQLTEAFLFKGLSFFSSNAAFGDYVKVELVDKDNILGLGANTILKTPINKAYVQATTNSGPIKGEDVSAAELPAAGLYLRVHYTNGALLTSVTCYVNLILYRRN